MFKESLKNKTGQLLHQAPTLVALRQMVTIRTSFLPGSYINSQGYFCYKEIMAQHMESSLSRSRKKSVSA